jgi:hypothetical protein
MNLSDFLVKYFDEDGVGSISRRLGLKVSGSKEEIVLAIIKKLDEVSTMDKAENAMEVVFDYAFELEDIVIKRAIQDEKLDPAGSKIALLNRVMASIAWPSAIEAQVSKDVKLSGTSVGNIQF